MKKAPILFLQAVIILISIIAVVLLIRFPLLEGRAKNLDLISIYADPLILYGYLASVPFFIGLYQVFQFFGYIGNDEVFAPKTAKTLTHIKKCALLLGVMIILAGIFIRFAHDKNDDPAGFIALCLVTAFVSAVVATAASVFEKILKKGAGMIANTH